MKKFLAAVALILAVLAIAGGTMLLLRAPGPVPAGEPTPVPSGAGWIALFDEAHRDGWNNITDEKDIFAFDGDVLHIPGVTVYPLRYVGYESERYTDFDLHLEFKLSSGANSGLFLRMQPGDLERRGFEVQVLEDYGSPPDKNSCGAIYDVVSPMFNMARPQGAWNSYDIKLRGPEVEVVMNGWLIVKADLSKMTMPLGKFKVPYAELPYDGLIALQDHGGEVWYRNLMIKPAD